MSDSEKKDFFGLFGCSNSSKDSQTQSNNIEDGEIVEKTQTTTNTDNNSELNSEDFEKLMEKYQKELQTRTDLKNDKVCRICFQNSTKYTCPKCALKTCSLQCCLFHKKHFGCDGVRDRLSFIPLTSYTNKDLLSDCSFLEEARETLLKARKKKYQKPRNMNKIAKRTNG